MATLEQVPCESSQAQHECRAIPRQQREPKSNTERTSCILHLTRMETHPDDFLQTTFPNYPA